MTIHDLRLSTNCSSLVWRKHVHEADEEEADGDPELRLVNCCAAAARLYLMQKNQIWSKFDTRNNIRNDLETDS